MNQGLKTATFEFARPFKIGNATASRVSMDMDPTKNYTLLMNWGVFKNHKDESLDYVYGARKMSHAHTWSFLTPVSATALTMGWVSLVLSYLYLGI